MSVQPLLSSALPPSPDQVGFSPAIEEELLMTMQVGIVGSDGVLIASDTELTDNNSFPRKSWNETKFKINRDCGVAIAMAGGMVTAGHLADEIIALALKDENWLYSGLYVRSDLAKRVLVLSGAAQKECQCIVASLRPIPKLRIFRMVTMSDGFGLVGGEDQQSKIYAGDEKNSAVFWAERYYPKRHPKLPIKTLVPLAAHLIVASSRVPNGGISGLEIILCHKDDGMHRLSVDSINELESKSSERDNSIGKSLLDGSQQFSYAPDVAV
jgi:hypothetical protein